MGTAFLMGQSGGGSSNADFRGIIERTAFNPVLPDDLTTVGQYAFYYCSNLALTSLPRGITSIGYYAFANYSNLALTSLPSGITGMGDYAFYHCTNLALTSLPSGITYIGVAAFNRCSNLALTSLPSGVTNIEYMAFYYCTNLVKLKCWCTSLGQEAFENCTGLTKIWIPSTCITISAYSATSSPFYGCTNVVIYTNASNKLAGWNTYWNYTGDSTQATVNYNITEAQFDAL